MNRPHNDEYPFDEHGEIQLPTRIPEDPEAERSLLATCCAPGNEAVAAEVLSSLNVDAFVVPKHRALYTAALTLAMQGQEINALTLRDVLATTNKLNEVEGFAGLTELLAAEEVGRPHVLADILRKHQKLRNLIRVGSWLTRNAMDGMEDPDQMAREAAQGALDATEGTGRPHGEPRAAHEALTALYHEKLNHEHSHGLMTGIPKLDKLTGGLHPGNLMILAARPGLGKTALALQIALHAAQAGIHVGFWTLEMTEAEVLDRLLAQLDYLDAGWARNRKLTDMDLAQVLQARDYLMTLPIDICDDASISPANVRFGGAKAKAKGNPYGLIVTDYIQLFTSDNPKKADKQTDSSRVGDISRSLKLMAKEFHIPVIALSQLNRELESRGGARPRLSDLRDSGSLEQDADQVVFIHRKVLEGKPEEIGELVIPKDRHGETGLVDVVFLGEKMRFRELEYTTENPKPYGGGAPALT